MYSWQIAVIVVIVVLLVYSWRRELFGESIYLGGELEIRGDSEKRPAVFTSGATQRNLGQVFSATDQGLDRTY
jgi:hypothetical protein